MSELLNNRYALGEMIGTGGMADVYIGDDTRLNRKVAIKVLRRDLARDPSFVARFKKEALAAGGLNHSGIVAVYDSGDENNSPYIVMELISGQTLRQVMQQGLIPQGRALEIIEGILQALEYSHKEGIVHRDIKPGNIMITDSGDIKVMDFGIARATDDIGATMTNTWNVIGTAQYLSPEQAQGSIADARSDLYSTGCLLYELLTGRPPFTGETPVSIALQHVSAQFLPARSIQPDLPADVETVLAVALSKSPDARYQDALSMLADVKRLKSGVQVTTKIARVHPFKRRSFIIAGISVFIAATLAIVGLSLNGASEPSVGYELPNVIGLTEDQAREALSEYLVTVTRAHDPRIPAGRIASQIPLASSDVPPGSGVVLTISDGPGDAIVPDGLIGLDLIDARAALAAVGLVVSQTIATSSTELQGTVLEVTPIAGSTITAGSGVILTIANGEVEVPNLLGVEAIQAKTLLFNADFLIKEFYDYDPTQPIGVVIRQAPDAGTSQTIGNSVTITINRAP